MLILSLFTMGDVRPVFEVFLRFMSRVVHEITRVKGLRENGAATAISQLVIRLGNDKPNDKSLRGFTAFLGRILRRVPEIVVPTEVNLGPLQAFIDEHGADCCAKVRRFMDQSVDQQILIFSFAQNMRFLANMQKADRTLWIPLL
jgi:hypothetical protein